MKFDWKTRRVAVFPCPVNWKGPRHTLRTVGNKGDRVKYREIVFPVGKVPVDLNDGFVKGSSTQTEDTVNFPGMLLVAIPDGYKPAKKKTNLKMVS